jgi:hypothetical protein
MIPISRLLSLCSGLAAVLVLLATASVASAHSPPEFGDWLFLLPFLVPLLTAVMAVSLFFLRTRSRMLSGSLWGVFAGANLLLIHQALRLTLQSELIRRDGTAYWGLLSLPAFYGGIAAICLGGVLGLGIGLVLRHIPLRGAEPSGEREPPMTRALKS